MIVLVQDELGPLPRLCWDDLHPPGGGVMGDKCELCGRVGVNRGSPTVRFSGEETVQLFVELLEEQVQRELEKMGYITDVEASTHTMVIIYSVLLMLCVGVMVGLVLCGGSST